MEKAQVKLHGTGANPYSKRVELALKLKGIPYEYIEEDMRNKSQQLLQYNPVHKKIPVLVHDGRPICESLIILEYIDETWKNRPRLLPDDPYDRAQVRFWVSFIQQQLFDAMGRAVLQDGEAQAKAIKETHEKINILEDRTKEFLPDSSAAADANTSGLLGIMVGTTFGSHNAYERVLGVSLLDPHRYPSLFTWVERFNDLPVVKELMPSQDQQASPLQIVRQNALASSSSTAPA